MTRAIRILVVDDSATARQLLIAILNSDPALQVVGEASNGVEAVDQATRLAPDLITMDVQMPLMDGIEATKEIMIVAPTPILVVSAAGPGASLDLSFDAMQAGALMVLPKPASPMAPEFEEQRRQLLEMAKGMAQVKVVRRWGPRGPGEQRAARALGMRADTGPLVAIGASTGGPAALRRILIALPADFPAPIAIVQHIAKGFVSGLASWLSGSCSLHVKVADQGEKVVARTVYIAPDDRHLGFAADGSVMLSDAPAIGGFRPSVTHLFAAAASAYGSRVIALLMTGMGSDGAGAVGAVRAAGGVVLVQDEETSVVYGMGQEAVKTGFVNEVISLDRIPPRLLEMLA
ncbi:MAG: chemotaxis-specific protein-glutamate methyltransferase CheB [Gemmatimonadota bacterium]|nr:chemotaxis-specific protein-glutamate methyltransferase CheB [Gemmatimonadota bacterium]